MTLGTDAQPATDPMALFDRMTRGNVLAADCPSRAVLQHLTSRWGVLVMVALAGRPHRFSELRRAISGVSERMLSQVLKELEADGFVLRTAHAVVPPHVDYSLTPLGEAAAQRLGALVSWIEDNLASITGGVKEESAQARHEPLRAGA